MCLVKHVQEVSCCFYIRHDGERIINIPSIEERQFTLTQVKTLSEKLIYLKALVVTDICISHYQINEARNFKINFNNPFLIIGVVFK